MEDLSCNSSVDSSPSLVVQMCIQARFFPWIFVMRRRTSRASCVSLHVVVLTKYRSKRFQPCEMELPSSSCLGDLQLVVPVARTSWIDLISGPDGFSELGLEP